jgi:hypothetical protein
MPPWSSLVLSSTQLWHWSLVRLCEQNDMLLLSNNFHPGSIFYDLPNTTDALYSRGALLFFGILLAAFASALEVSLQGVINRIND